LQTVQALQEEIEELRKRKGMTDDEKAELSQLKKDLAEAREELRASRTVTGEPSLSPAHPKRIVNYGTFCIVEEDAG
jgi:ribosome-interacting GTPase 1